MRGWIVRAAVLAAAFAGPVQAQDTAHRGPTTLLARRGVERLPGGESADVRQLHMGASRQHGGDPGQRVPGIDPVSGGSGDAQLHTLEVTNVSDPGNPLSDEKA